MQLANSWQFWITGSALLLQSSRAVNRVRCLVNGYFDPGKLVAFPADCNRNSQSRFGAAPSKAENLSCNSTVRWTGLQFSGNL